MIDDMGIAGVSIPEPGFGDRFAILEFGILDNLPFHFVVPSQERNETTRMSDKFSFLTCQISIDEFKNFMPLLVKPIKTEGIY